MPSTAQAKPRQPSLRAIVALAILLAVIIFIGSIAFIFLSNMLTMLGRSDEESMVSQSELLTGIITSSLNSIPPAARELATWDDTYNFALGANPGYIEKFWNDDTSMERQQLNFVAMRDLKGNNLFVRFYDYETDTVLQTPEGIEGILDSFALELEGGVAESGENGFVFIDSVPYFITALPILNSETSSMAAGYFIAGRVFNNEILKRLSNLDDVAFAILDDAGSSALSGEAGSWRLPNSRNTEVLHNTEIVTDDDDTIIYKQLPSFKSGDITVLSMQKPRTLYRGGMALIRDTGFAIGMACIMFGILLYYLMSRLVIRPLNALSKGVQAVTVGGGNACELDVRDSGKNRELTLLGESINNMLFRLQESYKLTEQSSVSINILKGILNGLDANIYVSDPNTDEILFINDSMREHFGLKTDVVGEICYRVLQDDFGARCDFCPNYRLEKGEESVVVWEEHNSVTGRFYKNTDRMIEWTDGQLVHMQHSVDISDVKVAQTELSSRLRQQELMSVVSQSFISDSDVDELITDALRLAGEEYGVDFAFVSRIDHHDGALYVTNAWRSASMNIDGMRLPMAFRERLTLDKFIAVDDVRVCDAAPTEFSGGASLYLPLFIEGGLWGVCGFVGRGRSTLWSESELQMGRTVSGIFSGVLTRRQMESQLVLMSSIVGSSPQTILYIGKDGKFEYYNPATPVNTGYSDEELEAGGIGLLFDTEVGLELYDEIMPHILEKGRYTFELPILRSDGRERILSFNGFTIGGDRSGYGVIAVDVTAQRLLERELVNAKEQAEAASRSKGEFLSRMSHEMRTPMNAIIGMTNIARNAEDVDRKQYCLDKIDNASKHLLGVINDILDMSKIEANKLEISVHEFDFEKMLINVTNVVNFRAEEKKQNLFIHLEQDIGRFLIGDETRLGQVITNLLSNAIKFTPNGGTVALAATKEAEEGDEITLRVEVIDTGIGISEEQQSRLFRSFEQADGGIARKFGGTGLGLAISKRIVELMGGRIWVESRIGEGSKFIFTIKAGKGKCAGKPRLSKNIRREELRMLAVDDSPETREFFLHVCESLKLPCDIAGSGEEALSMMSVAAANEQPYTIIFVDWHMPGMDGVELTREIRAMSGDHAIVIMISVAEWVEIEAQASEAGVDRFLPKPLFSSTLMDCVNECIGGVSADQGASLVKLAPQKGGFEGRRVLLVEDVEINREIVVALLEDTGLTIDSAENGVEAVDAFVKRPQAYDLILMDVHMPEMDGYEATRRIRALDAEAARSVPIVAMTANVFREDVEQCLDAGMDDHIGKPVDVSELYTKLDKYLKGRFKHNEVD